MSPTPSSKRQKLSSGRKKSKKAKKKASPTGGILRVSCPVSFVGNVIGKGGLAISQLRQQTGAIIKVEDAVPGCLERVILFVGCEDQAEGTTTKELKKGEVDENVYDEVKKDEVKKDEDEDDVYDEVKKDEDDVKDSSANDDGTTEADSSWDVKVESSLSSAQMALLKTFDKMIEGEKETMDSKDWGDKPHATSLKLVVFASQADFLKRFDGGTFEEISSESGAQICFLPNDERPSCVSDFDELLQIAGEIDEIKKAVVSITHKLLENPPQTSELSQQKIPRPPSFSAAQTQTQKENANDRIRDSATAITGHRIAKLSNDSIKMSFRLLCPEIKAGAVIGRGGGIVKGLQQDTGCEIDVSDHQVDAEERIILISGPAHPDDRVSPIQDAVLRVQARIIRSPPESNESNVTARLLVPSWQISALLSRCSTILAEIGQLSKAQVHVLGKEHLPKRVSLNDDLVQVTGDFEAVQEALLHLTGQLQRQLFPTNLERRGFFQGALPPPPQGFYNDELSPFMHNIQRLGVPLHILGGNSSPLPWRPKGIVNGALRMGVDYVEHPIQILPGGINPAVITNTTVEVVVPSSVIPSIYGEGGGCLQQIRQISDATVVIADPKPGATETMITISGTPEQTNAAQSLIQAFVICESQST